MFDLFPVLVTERLVLVEIRQEHLGDIYKLFSDDKVTRFYNVVTLKSLDEAQVLIDWFHKRFVEKAGIRWGISLKGQENIIGTIGFNNITKQHKAAIGYDLQSGFWHKGYLTEALRAVVCFGFQRLEINRIEGEVMPGNDASEKVLLHAGFKNEGVLRDWMYWNDKHYDMTMFSLLKSEFTDQSSLAITNQQILK